MLKFIRSQLGISRKIKVLSHFSTMNPAESDIPDPSKMRISYEHEHLDEKKMEKDPLDEFKHWFKFATDSKQVLEPNAMILSTSSKKGLPSARPVLLKVILPFIFSNTIGIQRKWLCILHKLQQQKVC
jgi:hypothetical protein